MPLKYILIQLTVSSFFPIEKRLKCKQWGSMRFTCEFPLTCCVATDNMYKFMTKVKIFIAFLLFIVFLQLFGRPAFERYKNESVLVEKKVLKDKALLDSPGVTVCVDPSEYPEFILNFPTNFNDLCNNITKAAHAIECLENKFYNYSQMINRTIWNSQNLTMSNWDSFMSSPMHGKCFTTGKGLKLGKITAATSASMFLNTSIRYNIFIHDPKFFILSANPESVPQIFKTLELPKGETFFAESLYITVTKHLKKNRQDAPCEAAEEYSFTECVKDSVLVKAGCDQVYHRRLRSWKSCRTIKQLQRYLNIYDNLAVEDIAGVRRLTGCKTPCSYLQYKGVGNKVWRLDKNLTVLQLALSFASTEVALMKEILIYPLTSFLAEVGGSLGLFLGFSLLMVWDLISAAITYIFMK